jgi:hypothetical protein
MPENPRKTVSSFCLSPVRFLIRVICLLPEACPYTGKKRPGLTVINQLQDRVLHHSSLYHTKATFHLLVRCRISQCLVLSIDLPGRIGTAEHTDLQTALPKLHHGIVQRHRGKVLTVHTDV